MAITTDPLNVNARLYKQISKLLDDLEKKPKFDADGEMIDGVTTRERIAGLVAIARIQTLFVGLRKEGNNAGSAGSAVRKYQKAFNAVGGGKKVARSTAADDIADAFGDDDDPDAAA